MEHIHKIPRLTIGLAKHIKCESIYSSGDDGRRHRIKTVKKNHKFQYERIFDKHKMQPMTHEIHNNCKFHYLLVQVDQTHFDRIFKNQINNKLQPKFPRV